MLFRSIGAAPAGTRWVRYWDLAATEEKYGTDPAYTAGVKLGRMPDGRFVVGDVARLRAEAPGVRRLMKDTAKAARGMLRAQALVAVARGVCLVELGLEGAPAPERVADVVEELVLRDAQLQQRGLLVVGVELAEVGQKARVVEKAAGQRYRRQLVGPFGHTLQLLQFAAAVERVLPG